MRKFFTLTHPSWCLYAGFFGVISSIAGGLIFNNYVLLKWPWFLVAMLLLVFSLVRPWKIMIACGFLAGMIIGNLRLAPEFQGQAYFQQMVGQEITISGKISEDPETAPGQVELRLAQLKIAESNLAGTLYVQLGGTNPRLERSDQIVLRGKLNEGFGVFVGTMFRPELIAVERAETGDIFARGKAKFAELVRDYIPSPEVDLGLGYLVGMKSGLSEEFTETLRAVGMTHVIVASGTHLGVLASAARKIFGRLSKFAGVLFSLLLISGFAMVVGFTPSMTRAALVSSLALLMGYVGRKFTPLRLLSFVATITLLINPLNFINLGWQLSFASFFALLILAPRLQKLFYGGKKIPWLASMLLTSLAATVICAPILIYNFGSLSLLSFVANLFILPTLPYVMFLVLLTGVASILPWLATIFGQLATWLLDAHIWLINYLSEKTMFIFELPSGNAWIFMWYLLVLALLISPMLKRLLRRREPP